MLLLLQFEPGSLLRMSEDEFSILIWTCLNTWKINLESGIFDKINLVFTHTSRMMCDIGSHTPVVYTRNKL